MTATRLEDRIRDLAGPLAAALGADLDDVEVRGARGSRVVRLVADADGGLDIDTIAVLSRDVGRALDEHDVVDGRYTLEVSSPGADRPLRTPERFRRNRGRTVRIVATGEARARGLAETIEGTIVDADADAVRLEVDGDPRTVALADVDDARLVLPW